MHHVQGLLPTILRSAVEDDYLSFNPRAHGPSQGAKPRLVPLSGEQVQAVIDALPER